MKPNSWNKKSRIAFTGFIASLMAIVMLLASFGADWGTAYGQTQTVPPVRTLIITISANPPSGGSGATIRFTISLRNPNAVQVLNTLLRAEFPDIFTITGATITKGAVTINVRAANSSVKTLALKAPFTDANADIGTLEPDETVIMVIDATVNPIQGSNLLFDVPSSAVGMIDTTAALTGASTTVLVNPSNIGGQPQPSPGLPNTGTGPGNPPGTAPGLPNPGTGNAPTPGVIPGLPNTGNGLVTPQGKAPEQWQIALLIGLTIFASSMLLLLVRFNWHRRIGKR